MYEEDKQPNVSTADISTPSKKKKKKSPARLAFNANKVKVVAYLVECKRMLGVVIPEVSVARTPEEIKMAISKLPFEARNI